MIPSDIKQLLKANDIETVRVGWNDENAKDDKDMSLTDRQKAIKNSGCTISVSCHANAFGDGKSYNSSSGIETLVHNEPKKQGDSKNLAKYVQAEMIKGTKQTNRGVKTQSLAMCNCVATGCKASILVEIGFMTNKYEADLMTKNDDFVRETGYEIARGILKYIGVANIKEMSATTSLSSNTTQAPNSAQFVVKLLEA